jgi:hypothetical protein
LEGEKQAAETLMQALGAESKSGAPLWKQRIDAAVSLLDRAGQRGKAIERQQIQAESTVTTTSEADRVSALKAALRDPGVRAWIEANNMMALPPMAEVEVVDSIEESA